MKKYLYLLLFALLSSIVFQGCFFEVATVGSWHNKTIDQDVRDEISALNNSLFKSIAKGNAKGVKKLMCDASVKTSGSDIDTILKVFSKYNAQSYRVLDEYYVKNLNEVSNVALASNNDNSNDYRLNFVAINKKTYVSVLVTTGLPVNFMILAIYGKYGDSWKLNILRVGDYSVMDQTAPDHYQSAINHFQSTNYIDAVDMIVVASKLADPGGDKFEYLNDNAMSAFYTDVMKEAKSVYKFPFVVDSIKSKPQIFAIGPQVVREGSPVGIFAVIKYKSHIALADTNAIKSENKALQKIIGTLFKGVDKNKPGIIYQAYNKFPTDSTDADHFTIKQVLGYTLTHSY
ncbi:hypothetical protein [Mucilaginibacter paludis]|uniref:Uncharacterized protein n=1 Tax=Mucilaginibacter paludis DSM 18603 TaxID=714943 RepID=H1Y3S2_9SPHI|nr:hypothetical protein [Mucilaginibacter paludis]EHQ30334.1 hypothetical protein Mucpa_6278 [Mucilaginibacter paludis DSM 18603]